MNTTLFQLSWSAACALACIGTSGAAEPPAPPNKVPALTVELPKILQEDEQRVLGEIARKIEGTLSGKASSEKTRDPDGRLGIYIDCPNPFLTPPGTPGMDVRKTWVLLAIFAAVTSTEGSPVVVDYIGLTDPEGANGKRWFYELDMKAAAGVQKEVFSGALTMEQGYEKIIASWRRVTRA